MGKAYCIQVFYSGAVYSAEETFASLYCEWEFVPKIHPSFQRSLPGQVSHCGADEMEWEEEQEEERTAAMEMSSSLGMT